jgi:hypothetical protein
MQVAGEAKRKNFWKGSRVKWDRNLFPAAVFFEVAESAV